MHGFGLKYVKVPLPAEVASITSSIRCRGGGAILRRSIVSYNGWQSNRRAERGLRLRPPKGFILMKITALIVDDEQPARDELAFLLKSFADVEVVGQGKNGVEAVSLVRELNPHLSHAATIARQVETPATLKVQPGEVTSELANVAGISSIVRQPNSEMVDVSYNQLVPRQITGSLDDPSIRQLLMLASENAASPVIRDDSVALLAAECKAGHSCQPSGIREALMVALRYDKSAKVREKALEGLEPYVAEDVRVRDAVLESLLSDNDPGVRTEAISLLSPVDADMTVRQVLYSVSNSDQDSQIRSVSREVLSRVPETQ